MIFTILRYQYKENVRLLQTNIFNSFDMIITRMLLVVSDSIATHQSHINSGSIFISDDLDDKFIILLFDIS